jgi:hypothetical protein
MAALGLLAIFSQHPLLPVAGFALLLKLLQ